MYTLPLQLCTEIILLVVCFQRDRLRVSKAYVNGAVTFTKLISRDINAMVNENFVYCSFEVVG